MAKKITITNQKGGVGKTTLVFNLAHQLKNKGKKVLVVDCDMQSNLSNLFDIKNLDDKANTLYHLFEKFKNDEPLPPKEDYIINKNDISIIPSNFLLHNIDLLLSDAFSREFYLKNILSSLESDYDIILIDTSPSLNILTFNALTFCDEVLIPITPEYLSLKGIELLYKTIMKIKKQTNPNLNILGIVLNSYSKNLNLNKKIELEITEIFDGIAKIFNEQIIKTVKFGEANNNCQDIVSYDSNSKGALSIIKFTDELLEELKLN